MKQMPEITLLMNWTDSGLARKHALAVSVLVEMFRLRIGKIDLGKLSNIGQLVNDW